MSKYATTQQFAGQRASVTRNVIVGSADGPRGGSIAMIDGNDKIYVFVPVVGANHSQLGAMRGYEFKETKTEADANALTDLEWSWPPRV